MSNKALSQTRPVIADMSHRRGLPIAAATMFLKTPPVPPERVDEDVIPRAKPLLEERFFWLIATRLALYTMSSAGS
eukprot:9475669-Pyramimonas_sp.AAC.1